MCLMIENVELDYHVIDPVLFQIISKCPLLLKASAMAQGMCPRTKQCSEWARIYINYCLCSVKDGISLSVGLLSVISWSVAEIPQIVTNYKEKSSQGLSIAFLTTWIIGDLFNLFGCLLEPATLPTQYYMAILYTFITIILAAQTIYYGHIYPRMKCNRWHKEGPILNQTEEAVKLTQGVKNGGLKQINNTEKWRNGSRILDKGNILSSPIPLPAFPHNNSSGRELYYMSARSLSSSHTPIAGSYLAHPASYPIRSSIEEALLDGDSSTQSAPNLNGGDISTRSAPNLKPKTMLCVVFAVVFLGIFNLHESTRSPTFPFENQNQAFVLRVGRKILKVSGGMVHESGAEGSTGIGTFLGWAMAAIYMGGRLPQILLNGLNPLMFVFALVGNATYVASILLNSLEWLKIKPNLPWLVDAGGCVLLDTFILIQFIYFRCCISN
ncbi:uncharacterized protein LOC8270529 isoform X2 [Ricinus communis]|uniref:uncharacterized protein LOC8270529 isoform X2 n=1 Tax=Ricinus communis TaxID=3988 RepID=UPI00201A7891|nr:uncharacterized protein LOC8270529 isoform X2 [Ricinus communis]